MNRRLFLTLGAMMLFFQLHSQNETILTINWSDDSWSLSTEGGEVVSSTFDRAQHFLENGYLPVFTQVLPWKGNRSVGDLQIEILETAGPFESKGIDFSSVSNFQSERYTWIQKEQRGKKCIVFSFLPLQGDFGGSLEKVSKIRISTQEGASSFRSKSTNFASTSVMATGEWYKIGVVEDGVYRISRSFLENAGIDVTTLNPQTLNIFGNGYGQLPFDNSVERPDDLLPNNIFVSGEGDEVFNEEDYILFYAKGPHTWNYDPAEGLFNHHKHDYSDTSYYFIGINTGIPPKRISNLPSSGASPNYESTEFNDYVFHERDRENVLKSGREWYGEKFDVQLVYNFSGERFTFPNIVSTSETVLRSNLLSRNTVSSGFTRFEIELNGASIEESFGSVPSSTTAAYGTTEDVELRTTTPASAFNINFSYQTNVPSASGWLNWFNINVRRRLIMFGAQMDFRDAASVGAGRITRFTLSGAENVSSIWEVTDPTEVKNVGYINQGSNAVFTLPTDQLRDFVAFTGSAFPTPAYFGPVANQNLHALGQESVVDMVIVSPPQFLDQAAQLAEIHRTHPLDPLNVEVVSLQAVYNEFSSGMRDVTAIKWLMKMLYDRADGNEAMMPEYLLLFGDGSFDNTNIGSGNTNLIPTYQSLNSLSPVNSYVSDDYFGLLSDDDGEDPRDLMDIGVGRIVAKNRTEASSVVNKIKRYIEFPAPTFDDECSVCITSTSGFGSWRNIITLVADDEDGNAHMRDSRTISDQIEEYTGRYNLERIFIDAFPQVATPGGARYPEVNKSIERRVRNGAFIINYLGHGGELGWAQERILDIPTILDWTNTNEMPIFVTATCEFTRFDDPLRTSAGEFVLLNGGGGGIALLTTTRLVYSGPNFILNQNFYDALFQRPENEIVTRLGNVYRETKNASVSSNSNHRNFSLIGDPALPMAIPRYDISITSITDTTGAPIDTLKALGIARVNGIVANGSQILSNFNGRVQAIVYDRVKLKTTLSNDGGNPFTFSTQEDVIYRGNAEVVNGEFSFDFVLPKDISFAVDTTARISLYAYSEEDDATGFENGLSIGDRDENAVDDGTGPEVQLYLNDENFVFGGFTNSEPVLLANIFDPNGINTVGNGIGHDITAVIDGDVSNTLVLNDYFESDLNTFKSGKVTFQLEDLKPGNHNVKFKVWDVHNNSKESYTEFIVSESEELAIERVLNYPNPFTTRTEFFFEHNQSCEFLNVLIDVYTVSGKLVKSINVVSNTDGFRNDPIPWDGRDDYGDKLATGVYVYKVSVRNPAGEKVEKFEKLVILN